MDNVIDTLRSRGFIEQISSEELQKALNQPLKIYCGFDPTGDSLHLGNLVAMMGLRWFEKFGHKTYCIVGGATGMIGDPSGKKQERQLLSEEEIEKNLAGITKNLHQVLKNPVVLNNFDWFRDFDFISFLRDVGKNFRMGTMLAKDSVKSRLASDEGMSFTEFSYQILQAYDFLHLFDTHGVTIQIGGSDQWGNITAGQELIRKVRGESVFGVTFPLLTSNTGEKFGKSEKGAIWLSPEKCSPFDFYQYLYRTSDLDVIKLLERLTFLPVDEIRRIEKEMQSPDYTPNSAQKILAREVTSIVHGEEGVKVAETVTEGVRPGKDAVLSVEILEAIAKDMNSVTLPRHEVLGQKLIDILPQTDLVPSKGEARRLVKNGGAYLNNQKIDDEKREILAADLIGDKLLLLGAGKKARVLLRIS